jgi:hypothetical protein
MEALCHILGVVDIGVLHMEALQDGCIRILALVELMKLAE